MRRLLAVVWWMSLAGLVASLAAPLAARALATEVVFISPGSPEEVAVNKELWAPGDPVVDIYGVPAGEPATILFPDQSKVIRPAEDPSQRLYVVDKQQGDNPLQAKMVTFFARLAALGFGIAAALVLAARYWWRRRSRRVGGGPASTARRAAGASAG
jgi:hypothetical protein